MNPTTDDIEFPTECEVYAPSTESQVYASEESSVYDYDPLDHLYDSIGYSECRERTLL